MAYSTISKPSLYFNTKLYTGNGSTNALTGVGFQPDFVWLKRRDSGAGHKLNDAVRGVNKQLVSNNTNAQNTDTNVLTAFGTDGFTLGNNSDVNGNNDSYVSWNWKAGGGQGSSNTNGSINTNYTSVNTTAGFSISEYTGTGSAATVGHGLGAAPQIVITKRTDSSSQWVMYNRNLGANKNLHLELTDSAASSSAVWNDTESTSTVFSIGNAGMVNTNGGTYIAYCFAEKKGYSKFGTYTGNGNADGTFIYTGFSPSFVIMKRTDGGGAWYTLDTKRPGYNTVNKYLSPNSSNAESTFTFWDFLSNGFKIRNNGAENNNSGGSYIYMAFAEEPLVANVGASIPATAR